MIMPGENWDELFAQIDRGEGLKIVYVIGASDSGKSSLCKFLCDALSKDYLTAFIDCDPGQSTIGPPTTVGLKFYGDENLSGREYLRFIGSVSPVGHMLQMLSSLKRLLEKSLALRAQRVVMDSSGFVLGNPAKEFQFQVIDCLHPHHVVALQQSHELESLLKNFRRNRRVRIHRLPISEHVVPRTQLERQAYREQKFKEYFNRAAIVKLDTRWLGFHGMIPDFRNPDDCRGRVAALCDADNFVITVAIVQSIEIEQKQIEIFSPPFDANRVASIQFGRLQLTEMM